jgi:CBS domain-containing protein
MRKVKDILRTKGSTVWSIAPDATVYDALALMADKNIGAVLVTEAGEVAGILSERDYARKVVLQGKSAEDTPVREIMTERVMYVRPEQTVDDCMALMTDKHVRHLPVVEDDRLLGVISIGDVVKIIISEQEFLIEQLEHYITGAPPRPWQFGGEG